MPCLEKCTGYPRKAAESSLRQVNPTRFGNLLVLQFHLNRFIRFMMASATSDYIQITIR